MKTLVRIGVWSRSRHELVCVEGERQIFHLEYLSTAGVEEEQNKNRQKYVQDAVESSDPPATPKRAPRAAQTSDSPSKHGHTINLRESFDYFLIDTRLAIEQADNSENAYKLTVFLAKTSVLKMIQSAKQVVIIGQSVDAVGVQEDILSACRDQSVGAMNFSFLLSDQANVLPEATSDAISAYVGTLSQSGSLEALKHAQEAKLVEDIASGKRSLADKVVYLNKLPASKIVPKVLWTLMVFVLAVGVGMMKLPGLPSQLANIGLYVFFGAGSVLALGVLYNCFARGSSSANPKWAPTGGGGMPASAFGSGAGCGAGLSTDAVGDIRKAPDACPPAGSPASSF